MTGATREQAPSHQGTATEAAHLRPRRPHRPGADGRTVVARGARGSSHIAYFTHRDHRNRGIVITETAAS